MKVKFGSIIVSGRGTLGGHVYSENHYGPFARTKVNPFNPTTTRQQEVRNIFETIQTAWRNLSPSERLAWKAATPDYPQIDYSGTVYFLTGYNLFIKLNIPVYTFSLTLLTSPPVKAVPTSNCDGTITMDFTTNTFSMLYSSAPNESNVYIQIYGTRPLSAGIEYVSTELRLITLFQADGSNPVDWIGGWRFLFGADPASGQKIFTKLVPVNVVTGDYGVPFIYSNVQP